MATTADSIPIAISNPVGPEHSVGCDVNVGLHRFSPTYELEPPFVGLSLAKPDTQLYPLWYCARV